MSKIVKKRKDERSKLYNLLKSITEYILGKIDKEPSEEVNKIPVIRVWKYLVENPHVIWWINKYLNHKFHRYSTLDAVKTARFIYQNCFQNKGYRLNISKSTYEAENELLEQLKVELESGLELRSTRDFAVLKYLTLYAFNTIDRVVKELESRLQGCTQCPLKNNPRVILDTNLNYVEQVDVMFIGLNPGNEEAKQGKPFVGPAGQLLRSDVIDKIDCKWVITNCILCSTSNEASIPDPQRVAKLCRSNLNYLISTFRPRLLVLIGDTVVKSFGIEGKITELNGKLIDEKYFVIIHPSAVLRNRRVMEDKWRHAVSELLKLLGYDQESRDVKSVTTKQLSDQRLITWKDVEQNKLLLFMIRILPDDTVLYVFTDTEGRKYYLIDKNAKCPVYIKKGSLPHLQYMESKFDEVHYLKPSELNTLRRFLNKRVMEFN